MNRPEGETVREASVEAGQSCHSPNQGGRSTSKGPDPAVLRCMVFSTVAGYCEEPAIHRFAGTPMCARHLGLFRDPEGNTNLQALAHFDGVAPPESMGP